MPNPRLPRGAFARLGDVSALLPHWSAADWVVFAALLAGVVVLVASLVPLLNLKTLP